jgi:hypothetical protein
VMCVARAVSVFDVCRSCDKGQNRATTALRA